MINDWHQTGASVVTSAKLVVPQLKIRRLEAVINVLENMHNHRSDEKPKSECFSCKFNQAMAAQLALDHLATSTED